MTSPRTERKRGHPYSGKAKMLALFIDSEMKRHKDEDRFAVLAHRQTWEVIRMALRKMARS